MRNTTLTLLGLALLAKAYSATFYVAPNGAGDCTQNNPCNLQTALDRAAASSDNDTIYLSPSIYTVNPLTYKPSISAGSLSIIGEQNVVLNANSQGRVLEIDTTGANDDGINISIKNITVTNGFVNDSNDKGAGIKIKTKYADIEVKNCTFKNNTASQDADGAGLYILTETGNIDLEKSKFENNNSDDYSGGFDLTSNEGRITVSHNIVINNSGGYGGGGTIETSTGRIDVINNIFAKNRSTAEGNGRGGGLLINLNAGETYIINNTIAKNSSSAYGGGLHIKAFDNHGRILIYNNISFFNTADRNGDDIYIETEKNDTEKYEPTIYIENNDYHYVYIENETAITNAGKLHESNNLAQDPLFVDAENGDYHLQNTSPVIDKGASAPVLPVPDYDIDGEPRLQGDKVDIGADEVPVTNNNQGGQDNDLTGDNQNTGTSTSSGGGGGGCSLAPSTSPANALLYLALPMVLLLRRLLRK